MNRTKPYKPRQPGKRVRDEVFHVDSVLIPVEIRMADDGKLFCVPDERSRFEAPSLAELRKSVQQHLEETRRLAFVPVIVIDCLGADVNSRFDRGCENTHKR